MRFRRKKATWKPITFEGMLLSYQCSNCGHTEWFKVKKCKHCKAHMENADG